MRTDFRHLTLIALSAVLICTEAVVAAAEDATTDATAPTIDQVIAAWDSLEKRFFGASSFLLVYERTNSRDVTASLASGSLLPAVWRFAHKGDQWLVERQFTKPYESKKIHVPAEPKTEVVRKNLILEDTPENRRALLMAFDLGQNIYGGLFYTINLSLDAPKFIASSNGVGDKMDEIRRRYADDLDFPFLPDFLRQNRSYYRVLPTAEEVDGKKCWVVEWPGMDRIWVDPLLGYAARRRAYCWGPGKALKLEIFNKDYRNVGNGLWLPFAQIVDKYASVVAENPSIWGKVTCITEYKVESIEFDKLTDAFFDIHLPPGTVVLDQVRHFEYVVPDAELADPFANAIHDVRIATRPWWAYLLIAINLGVLVFIMLAIYIRAARAKTARQ